MPEIILLAHNIRSTHNVGSIFRTCEGFGVKKIYLSGYSPYPEIKNDTRLPHIRLKLSDQIHKTALGAEKIVPFKYSETLDLNVFKNQGYRVVALEQDERSVSLKGYSATEKIALLIGEEVHGIEKQYIDLCDDVIEIPMKGQKESFNVSVATGIALYQLST